ncbi:hypothetical protein, partial [Desulfosporosinus metallidurans]|uniref:hypothetical protein n=2 Tax=Bacteria TaxID=2 RepID=UPI000B075B2E
MFSWMSLPLVILIFFLSFASAFSQDGPGIHRLPPPPPPPPLAQQSGSNANIVDALKKENSLLKKKIRLLEDYVRQLEARIK